MSLSEKGIQLFHSYTIAMNPCKIQRLAVIAPVGVAVIAVDPDDVAGLQRVGCSPVSQCSRTSGNKKEQIGVQCITLADVSGTAGKYTDFLNIQKAASCKL